MDPNPIAGVVDFENKKSMLTATAVVTLIFQIKVMVQQLCPLSWGLYRCCYC